MGSEDLSAPAVFLPLAVALVRAPALGMVLTLRLVLRSSDASNSGQWWQGSKVMLVQRSDPSPLLHNGTCHTARLVWWKLGC